MLSQLDEKIKIWQEQIKNAPPPIKIDQELKPKEEKPSKNKLDGRKMNFKKNRNDSNNHHNFWGNKTS